MARGGANVVLATQAERFSFADNETTGTHDKIPSQGRFSRPGQVVTPEEAKTEDFRDFEGLQT